jgi:hypothetical protein
MVNEELKNFVKGALAKGEPKEKITTELLTNGWNHVDISEVFNLLEKGIPPSVYEVPKPIHKERSSTNKTLLFVIILLIVSSGAFGAYSLGYLDSILGKEEAVTFENLAPETPLPQEGAFSDWKTYTNEEHKFSFQYPKDWAARNYEGDPGISIDKAYTQNIFDYCKLRVNFYPGSLEDYKKNNPVVNSTNVKIAELEGVRSILKTEVGIVDSVVLKYSDTEILISAIKCGEGWREQGIKTFDQILSTFKFMGDRAWQTYTNPNWGFEFKYPAGWKYEITGRTMTFNPEPNCECDYPGSLVIHSYPSFNELKIAHQAPQNDFQSFIKKDFFFSEIHTYTYNDILWTCGEGEGPYQDNLCVAQSKSGEIVFITFVTEGIMDPLLDSFKFIN